MVGPDGGMREAWEEEWLSPVPATVAAVAFEGLAFLRENKLVKENPIWPLLLGGNVTTDTAVVAAVGEEEDEGDEGDTSTLEAPPDIPSDAPLNVISIEEGGDESSAVTVVA